MKIANKKLDAFTRADLIAILAIVGVLAVLTIPLHGDATSENASIVCRANKRQLIRALHLYTMDNGGLLPPNGGDPTPGRVWVSGYTDFTGTDSTNYNLLTSPTTSLLANYLERSPRPFKCPADLVMTRDRSGRFVPRVRSVSMNNAVGTDPYQPKSPAPGMWLDGGFGHTANQRWRCFGKLSDMVRPAPADLWVLIDEHPDSINDSHFGSIGPGPSQKRWIDWAAAYHNGGAGFGMADGSAQIHNWVVPVTRVTMTFGSGPPLPASLPDLLWLADRTSALITDQP